MTTPPTSLAQERSLATSEERTVLALEMIADQLRSIAADLRGITVGHLKVQIDTLRTSTSTPRSRRHT